MASPHTKVSVTLIPAKDDLEGSRSTLEVEATSSAFREGKLKLRCLAKIYTIYRRTEEVEILEDTPQLAPVMGPTAPHSHDSSTSSQSSSEMQFVVLCSLSTLLRVFNSR